MVRNCSTDTSPRFVLNRMSNRMIGGGVKFIIRRAGVCITSPTYTLTFSISSSLHSFYILFTFSNFNFNPIFIFNFIFNIHYQSIFTFPFIFNLIIAYISIFIFTYNLTGLSNIINTTRGIICTTYTLMTIYTINKINNSQISSITFHTPWRKYMSSISFTLSIIIISIIRIIIWTSWFTILVYSNSNNI